MIKCELKTSKDFHGKSPFLDDIINEWRLIDNIKS